MNIEGKRIVCLDYESFYSTEYSLSKMTTAEYVRDSRFEAIGVGVSVNFEFPHWHHGAGIWKVLRELELDREDTIAAYHNANFDAAITEWHYGIRHNQILCTMMGAGPTLVPFSPQNRRSLAKLATLCDVGPKGGYLATVKGKRYHGLSTEELCKLGEYCVNDVEITNELAKKILRDLPESEIKLIDLTVRKFVRPEIILGKEVLQEHLMSEQGRKARLLEDCDIDDPALLRSNDKFAELLERYGAVPPTKVSLVTKKETFAFAKTDPGFKELLNEGPPDVQALCAARVGFKSTLEETRAQRFLRCADLDAPFSVPLLYWGARTGRFSGMDAQNVQNIPKKGNLRRSMTAPPGHKIVAGDLAQIEARVLATLAGQKDLVEIFRDPTRDAYREFGAELYKLPPAEISTQQRHVSKMGRLALGFGQGHDKFRATLAASWIPVHVTKQEARRIVQTYRRTHPRIVHLWDAAGMQWIPKMMGKLGDRRPIRYGPLTIAPGFIGLPNGTSIQYPNLTVTRAGGQEEVWYGLAGNQQHRLWGSKCVENCVQALARIILTSAELWLAERGCYSCLSVHDELVYIIRTEYVEKFKQVLHKVLTRPVPWMPNLPLDAEVTSGQNYADQS